MVSSRWVGVRGMGGCIGVWVYGGRYWMRVKHTL